MTLPFICTWQFDTASPLTKRKKIVHGKSAICTKENDNVIQPQIHIRCNILLSVSSNIYYLQISSLQNIVAHAQQSFSHRQYKTVITHIWKSHSYSPIQNKFLNTRAAVIRFKHIQYEHVESEKARMYNTEHFSEIRSIQCMYSVWYLYNTARVNLSRWLNQCISVPYLHSALPLKFHIPITLLLGSVHTEFLWDSVSDGGHCYGMSIQSLVMYATLQKQCEQQYFTHR